MKRTRKYLAVLMALALCLALLPAALASDEIEVASESIGIEEPVGAMEPEAQLDGEEPNIPTGALRANFDGPVALTEALAEAVTASGYNTSERKSLTAETAQSGVTVALPMSGDFLRNGMPESYAVHVQRDGGSVERLLGKTEVTGDWMHTYILIYDIDIGADTVFAVAYDRSEGGSIGEPAGDMDHDGELTSSDAVLILQSLDAAYNPAGDADGDGRITVYDAVIVLLQTLGLREPAPQNAQPPALP